MNELDTTVLSSFCIFIYNLYYVIIYETFK